MRTLPLWIATTMLLTACGDQGAEPSARVAGDAPTTPAALAYVAAEHVGEPDSAQEDSSWSDAFGEEPVQAELRFGSDGEYDGDAVAVAVGRGFQERFAGCEQLRFEVDGCENLSDGLWYWVEEEPEEDPGAVLVLQRKGPVTVLVSYAGPAITGDPRDQGLPIEVQALLDLAADPRVDVTTSEDAVEQGADADYWADGGK